MQAHKSSRYATLGSIDAVKARELVASMIARMTARASDKTFFWVAVKSGKVQGFLAAVIQPVYLVGDKLQTTDVYTLIDSAHADAADFLKLVSRFKEWSFSRPDVIEVQAGLTDIMGPEWSRLVPVYQRLGFEQSGVIMSLRKAA